MCEGEEVKVERETGRQNESRRGESSRGSLDGLKRNSGADIGGGDNWGIAPRRGRKPPEGGEERQRD